VNIPARQGGGPDQNANRPADPTGNTIYLAGAPVPPPDRKVTDLENALLSVTRDQEFPEGPGRRGYMNNNNPIILRTNYLKINTPSDADGEGLREPTWHRYDVNVTGATLSKQKKRRLVEKLIERPEIVATNFATEFGAIIVTTEPIKFVAGPGLSTNMTVPPLKTAAQKEDERRRPPAPETGTPPDHVAAARTRNTVTVAVTLSDTFSLRPLIEYLRSTSRGQEYQGRVDVIQLLNIIISRHLQNHDAATKVGGNKFFPWGAHPAHDSYLLGGGLDAKRGFFASARPTVGRLLLNLNVTHGAFYLARKLPDLLEISGLRGLEQQEAFITRLQVIVRYKEDGKKYKEDGNTDGDNPIEKCKTIVGFARPTSQSTNKRFGNAKEVRFSFTDQTVPNAKLQLITVFDYFRQYRRITLQHWQQPVLNVATRADPQYVPQELCTVMQGQPYRRLLGPDQTRKMIEFAVRNPEANALSIAGHDNPKSGTKVFRLVKPAQDKPDLQINGVNLFGFGVNPQMITVPGKLLQPPKILYGNGKDTTPRFGSWNLANTKFAVPGRFVKWQVLIINGVNNRPALRGAPEELFGRFENDLRGTYGISMGERIGTQTISLETLNLANRPTNDSKLVKAFQNASSNRVNMMLIVLPEADRWLYARIKYHGDVTYGIHTINAIGNKFEKERGQPQYFGNLALKFNIKGGGVCHRIPGVLARPLDTDTMLVGIDVTHPSPGSATGAPSIACVVASTDENLFQWPGSIRTQTGRQEMVSGLEDMVMERLALWRKKHNNKNPTKIVLYRDGVSEGQYQTVLQEELPCFESAFEKTYGKRASWPKMAVIIVGKRHHTRFYPTTVNDTDGRSGNPKAGTVVDRGIVGRILYEFYLQAHQGLQGTARPAHYVVIKDDIKMEPDMLVEFTYKLCHLFNRATKAVSICPPAYYADLLCERGRGYLFTQLAEDNVGDSASESSAGSTSWSRDVHPNLRESTWYI